MSRKLLFSKSFAAGQVFLAANVLYSLATVPLALKHLTVGEFGLWAVVMQIANFLLLLDAGFSSAAGRLLIDVKDDRPSLLYGRMFFATFFILGCATGLVVLIGMASSLPVISWMRIPGQLVGVAVTLLFGQILIAASTLPSRLAGGCLTAYGRIDLLNVIFTVSVVASWLSMWVAFECGAGVFALLWANAIGALCNTLGAVLATWRLGHLPRWCEFALPKKADIKQVVSLGQSIFLNQVGYMILNLSQSILLGRFIGLEAVGTWSIGSKMYTLILQSADKISQSAGPLCAEMWARKQVPQFSLRMSQIKLLALFVGSVGAAAIAGFNTDFVVVWTGGKVAWPTYLSVLIAVLFAVRVLNTVDALPIQASKEFGLFRFIPLCDALCFILSAYVLIPKLGIAGLLGSAVASSLLITTPYLAHRERLRITESTRAPLPFFVLAACAVLPICAAVCLVVGLSELAPSWGKATLVALVILVTAVPLSLLIVRYARPAPQIN